MSEPTKQSERHELVEPPTEKRCVNHCGHESSWFNLGICYYPSGSDRGNPVACAHRCEFEPVTAPERSQKTVSEEQSRCVEHCGWCDTNYDFFTQSSHCPHDVRPQPAAPAAEELPPDDLRKRAERIYGITRTASRELAIKRITEHLVSVQLAASRRTPVPEKE